MEDYFGIEEIIDALVRITGGYSISVEELKRALQKIVEEEGR